MSVLVVARAHVPPSEVARAHVPPSGILYSPVTNLHFWSLQTRFRRSRFDNMIVLEVARAHVPPSGKLYSPVKNPQHWSLQKFSR
ncbi:LOW QUALITY PROTEIN: hypothetical protein V1477_020792 [Vespula maculifrons]|uniref:Uncharacterized protein n=1 Tax=Vespula maculifrons TaxID=7453 RepID=A0ABD2ANT1_VESMC